jgi:hypothetical protein
MKFPQKRIRKVVPRLHLGSSEAISGGDGGTLQVWTLESQSCVQVTQGDGDGSHHGGLGGFNPTFLVGV